MNPNSNDAARLMVIIVAKESGIPSPRVMSGMTDFYLITLTSNLPYADASSRRESANALSKVARNQPAFGPSFLSKKII